MKLLVITPSTSIEHELTQTISLLENGLQTLHVRKPKFTTKQVREYIETIPPQFHKNLVIHSHHELAIEYNLKGIHYTKSHLKDNFKNWWRQKRIKISQKHFSKSCSHTRLASLYDEHKYEFDYVFLSPIFDSLSGKYQSGFYEEGIKAAIQKSGKKIIARGGIEIQRIEKINELGFYGMALFSCLWKKENPLAEYLKIVHRMNELNIIQE